MRWDIVRMLRACMGLYMYISKMNFNPHMNIMCNFVANVTG